MRLKALKVKGKEGEEFTTKVYFSISLKHEPTVHANFVDSVFNKTGGLIFSGFFNGFKRQLF